MLRIVAPISVAVVLSFGLSSPALADLVESQPEPEPKTKAELRAEAKQAKKDAKADAKAEDDDHSGGCSVQDESRNVIGLAALVLLVSGASLVRRRD